MSTAISKPTVASIAQLRDVPSLRSSVSPEEWEARVDLAAGYRLSHLHQWADSIYNHISMRVPGEPHMFLIKAHELLYNEVTASNLIKVDMRDDEVDERLHVNRPGFTLHGGLLAVRPDINSAFHTHNPATIAVANQKTGLAHHQHVAKPARIFPECLDLLKDLVWRARDTISNVMAIIIASQGRAFRSPTLPRISLRWLHVNLSADLPLLT